MKKILFILCTLIGINYSLTYAQDVVVEESADFVYQEDKIKYKDVKKIQDKVRYAMSDYQIYASLLGVNGTVSVEAQEQFSNLFDSNSKIFDDLAVYGSMIPFEDYRDIVAEYLPNDGVHFKIRNNKAYLDEITLDENGGYYYVKLQFIKTVYTQLNSNLKKYTCKSGKVVRMGITYSIPIDEIDADSKYLPKIYTCTGTIDQYCSDASMTITPSVRYGLGFIGMGGMNALGETPNKDLIDNYQAVNNDKGSVRAINLGAKLNYAPFKNNKDLSISGGLYLGIYSISHSFGGDYSKTTQTDKDVSVLLDDYERFILLRGSDGTGMAEEKISAITLEVPVGLNYKFFKNGNKTISILGNFNIVPIYTISSSAKIKGQVSYQGWYEESELLLRDLPSWSFGTDEDVNVKNSMNSNFSLALELSPTVQYVLNESTGMSLEFGVDYRLGLTSLFKHEKTTDVLLGDNNNDTRERSVLENYFNSSRVNSFGIRLGLVLQL